MKAFIVTGPQQTVVADVDPPQAQRGQVVVDVRRVGICGTDIEFFTGEMAYLKQGHARFPVRLGHEWCGIVSAVGDDVDTRWLGRRVTADTMIGCGDCTRCRAARHWVCEQRSEIGIRGTYPGALAEQLAVPVTGLYELPIEVSDTAGALIEPAGNAQRSVLAADLVAGEHLLVLGLGAIGLLCAQSAAARGVHVHLMGRSPRSVEFARSLGFQVSTESDLPDRPWDAVIDASNAAGLPAKAAQLVEPGRRIVYVGLAGTPSIIDTRELALKDATAVGILGASAGLAETIAVFATGVVDPSPLVAATVGLDQVGDVLAGWRPPDAGAGPKIHVDPRQ